MVAAANPSAPGPGDGIAVRAAIPAFCRAATAHAPLDVAAAAAAQAAEDAADGARDGTSTDPTMPGLLLNTQEGMNSSSNEESDVEDEDNDDEDDDEEDCEGEDSDEGEVEGDEEAEPPARPAAAKAAAALEILLFVDAANGFNNLSQYSMLWTVWHRCPRLATYSFNCYHHQIRLICCQPGGEPEIILSQESVTQGDPLAMVPYGIALLPLA